MTVQEMLARTSSREISEWMLYEGMEPFGERGQWLRNGILCATLVNLQVEKNDKVRPEDFMPDTMVEAKTVVEETPVTLMARAFGLTIHQGGGADE